MHFQNKTKLTAYTLSRECVPYFFLVVYDQNRMITHNYKTYFILMGLLVTLAGTRYEALNINPFQPPSPAMLMFLISLFCHAVASTTDMSFPTTIYIFPISGVVGCETLLWIILSQFSNWCIINSFVLVVTLVCHTNCIQLAYQLSCRTLDLFRPKHSNAATIAPLPPNSEPREAAHVQHSCGLV